MKKITDEEKKKVLLDLMYRTSVIMGDNNIRYFFAYGSLLGAIRHKGFIPWDDDIDVLVPRADYVRLIHLLEKQSEEYRKLNLEIIPYGAEERTYHKRFKIADTRTVMTEYGKLRSAVFIDFFPLDFYPGYLSRKFYRMIILTIDNMLVLCHSNCVTAGGVRKYTYKLLLYMHRVAGIKRMEHVYELLLIKATKQEKAGIACSTEAGYGIREFCPASCYSKTIILPFENLLVKCPSGYDLILRNLYGDYMVPPPKEKRTAHESYDMYWR